MELATSADQDRHPAYFVSASMQPCLMGTPQLAYRMNNIGPIAFGRGSFEIDK
ncbi:hypothetical protein [Bradyrhizobium nanningense]|uniref:hypothetical protein n=1 Tax=Bradyrhizobium nanningense TaxID=1325118 RepID=UPI0013E89ADB|nr:hypothetical protein [Bradyrhizobium nanningense]